MATFAVAYPKEVTIRGGERVVVRPLEPADVEGLLAHFMSLPQDERYFLAEDVTSLSVLEEWTRAAQEHRALALVALGHGRIVAQGAVARGRGPARAHLGRVQVTVAPAYRGRGLGTALLRELCELAAQEGMELLLAEAVEEVDREALHALEWLGFMRTGTIADAVRGPRGERYDLILLALSLERWQRWTEF